MRLGHSSEEKDFSWRKGFDLELNIKESSHAFGKIHKNLTTICIYIYIYTGMYTHIHAFFGYVYKASVKAFSGVGGVPLQWKVHST